MRDLFSDTRPEAEAVLIKLIREASPLRRIEMLRQLNAMARVVALAGLRVRFPDAGEAEIQRRLADLLLGPELAERVYGPLTKAEEHGG